MVWRNARRAKKGKAFLPIKTLNPLRFFAAVMDLAGPRATLEFFTCSTQRPGSVVLHELLGAADLQAFG
jgi:hypothetical protein